MPICLGLIVIMTLANLRGLKESGALFAPPTYLYVVMLMLLIVVGLWRIFVQHLGPIPLDMLSEEARELADQGKSLAFLMLLRAFSSGAVALSGVEAVSNGVPAFRKPESKNAAMTIAVMGAILGTCFLGVSILASHLQPYRGEDDATGIALMARVRVRRQGRPVLDHPDRRRSPSWCWRPTPRTPTSRACRRSSPATATCPASSPTAATASCSPTASSSWPCWPGVLIVVFKGNISALIPLYAFGVFTGFTLSQAGMVVHHFRLREPQWQLSAVDQRHRLRRHRLVALVVVVSKFTEGAWIPAIVIPVLVVGFRAINRHYKGVRKAVQVDTDYRPPRRTHTRRRARRVGAPRRDRRPVVRPLAERPSGCWPCRS